MALIKYTKDGQAIKIAQTLSYGFIVHPESDVTKPFFTKEVFDKPIISRYEEELEELKKQVNALKVQKRELDNLIQNRTDQYKELQKKWDRYDELKKLNLYLDGKITHFVRIPDYYYPSIHTFNKDDKEALCEGDRYYNKNILKLVSLFGKSGGDLQYKINQCSDGSGSYINIIPCSSYEEAEMEVIKWYIDKQKDKDYKITLEFVKRAKEVGVIVPESEVIRLQDLAKKNIMKNIEEIRLKLEKEEEKLDNL